MERNKSDYLKKKTHKLKMSDVFQIPQKLYIVKRKKHSVKGARIKVVVIW